MSRRCELTSVGVQYGNNVSHSHRKTRRRFEPNIRSVVYKSDITGEKYRIKVVAKAMRTVEKIGGFDQFLIGCRDSLLSNKVRKIRKEVMKKQGVA